GNGVSFNATAGAMVGGTAAGAANVISGNGTASNSASGIFVNAGSSSILVQGNKIGTNAAGTGAVPNRSNGVAITDSNNNTIGGASAAARNVVSGNGSFGTAANGVSVNGTSTGNSIQGNYIGTDVTGNGALGNAGPGVAVSASGNTVGGSTAGARNII